MTRRHLTTIVVEGRPATFATAHEQPWKKAVRVAIEQSGVEPVVARFEVKIEFRLAPSQSAGDSWDLDNLIKPTLDAMEGVFGLRAWRGVPQPADDRVDRLTASKRLARDGEAPGATIDVWTTEGKPPSARRMADPEFHEAQWVGRFDAHVAPINNLVDRLGSIEGGKAPSVATMYGGVNARLLSILRDPGPMADGTEGSGFLCMENDDPTAERIAGLFADSHIPAEEIVPWNVHPWYINKKPTGPQLEAGVEPLHELIGLMPRLCVVMVHGGSAKDGWRKFTRRYPSLIQDRKLHVIETYHTSRQAFWHKDPNVRAARLLHLQLAFAEASAALETTDCE